MSGKQPETADGEDSGAADNQGQGSTDAVPADTKPRVQKGRGWTTGSKVSDPPPVKMGLHHLVGVTGPQAAAAPTAGTGETGRQGAAVSADVEIAGTRQGVAPAVAGAAQQASSLASCTHHQPQTHISHSMPSTSHPTHFSHRNALSMQYQARNEPGLPPAAAGPTASISSEEQQVHAQPAFPTRLPHFKRRAPSSGFVAPWRNVAQKAEGGTVAQGEVDSSQLHRPDIDVENRAPVSVATTKQSAGAVKALPAAAAAGGAVAVSAANAGGAGAVGQAKGGVPSIKTVPGMRSVSGRGFKPPLKSSNGN